MGRPTSSKATAAAAPAWITDPCGRRPAAFEAPGSNNSSNSSTIPRPSGHWNRSIRERTVVDEKRTASNGAMPRSYSVAMVRDDCRGK